MKKLWVNRETLGENFYGKPIEELVNYSVFLTQKAAEEDAIEQVQEFGKGMMVDILEIEMKKGRTGFDIKWEFQERKDSIKSVCANGHSNYIFLEDAFGEYKVIGEIG